MKKIQLRVPMQPNMPGDVISIDAEQANKLIAEGKAVDLSKPAPKAEPQSAPPPKRATVEDKKVTKSASKKDSGDGK